MDELESPSIIKILHIHLPGLTQGETDIIVMSWIIIAFIVILAIIGTRKLKAIPGGLQNLFEIFIEFIDNQVTDILGPKGQKFFALIATFGMYIIFSNLIGLIPRFKSPTSSLNTTVALALITFGTVHFYGVKERGIVHYVKHYLGEVPWMIPLMFPLHIIGELAKPLSLSFRLFGNIMGEDIVLLVLFLLVPLVVPLPMMLLSIFTSVIQSFIFIMLSMVYIATMIEE